MKNLIFLSALALPAAALAQAAPAPAPTPAASAAPKVGATVTGKDGQPAGTIAQITAEAVVIDTGTNKVPVPPTSIGTSPKGPTIAMTKADLDAAYSQAAAQAKASMNLTPGTMVHGLNGAMLGTVKSADAEFVTVTTPKGDAKLPRNGFAPGENGTVRVGVTAEQLDAALGGSGPAAAPAATDTPAAAEAPAAAATPAATESPAPAATPKPKTKPKK